MISLTEVKSDFEKVLQAIQMNRTLLSRQIKTTGFSDQRITVENLEDLAGNHLFDDEPTLFGITELGGHKIRAYFQEGYARNYDFVLELHNAFPNVFEEERQEYLNRINNHRINQKLEPIQIYKN